MSSNEKLKDFFGCITCINNTKDIIMYQNDFLDDSG